MEASLFCKTFKMWTLQDIVNTDRQARQHKRITIDLTRCQYEIVRIIAQELFNWNILVDNNHDNQRDWNILWCDSYIQEEELRRLLPYQKINRFPGTLHLGRKNFLARNLAKMKRVHPEDYNIIPKTWLLPGQWEDIKQFIIRNNYNKILIVKPENSSQGKGIFLTRRIDGYIDYGEHYVIQEYITNPMLIDELKFDLRIYVLVKSLCPLKIFIYKEGLARFATVKYQKPSKNNLHDYFMHLTNYAINKKNPNFQFNEKDHRDHVGHKRSLSSVLKLLLSQGKNVQKLWKQIKKIIVSTLCSCTPYLQHVYRSCQPKEENNEIAFELFGFDIFIDDQCKPWLLEVNHTPSFSVDTPLDYQIKNCLITDTLILENVTWKARKQYYDQKQHYQINPTIKGITSNKLNRDEIDEKRLKILKWEREHLGGFEQIYPTDDEILQAKYDQFLQTSQDLFDEFSGAKINRIQKKDKDPIEKIQPTAPAKQQSKLATNTIAKTDSSPKNLQRKNI